MTNQWQNNDKIGWFVSSCGSQFKHFAAQWTFVATVVLVASDDVTFSAKTICCLCTIPYATWNSKATQKGNNVTRLKVWIFLLSSVFINFCVGWCCCRNYFIYGINVQVFSYMKNKTTHSQSRVQIKWLLYSWNRPICDYSWLKWIYIGKKKPNMMQF